MRLSAELAVDDLDMAFDELNRFAHKRMEAAALIATDRARRIAQTSIRREMAAAGLGRLGNAIGSNSDLEAGRGVHRLPGGGFSASGSIFTRSRSERTRGALAAYTGSGAEIRPRRGRWLWIATDNIPSKSGRFRMTPELYRSSGLEQNIGPLQFVKSVNGYPLLVAKNITLSAAGKTRSARALTNTGKVGRGRVAADFVVAFVGIPRTARQARVDVLGIIRSVQAELPALYEKAMGGQ